MFIAVKRKNVVDAKKSCYCKPITGLKLYCNPILGLMEIGETYFMMRRPHTLNNELLDVLYSSIFITVLPFNFPLSIKSIFSDNSFKVISVAISAKLSGFQSLANLFHTRSL